MPNYDRLLATANRLITKAGRPIVLSRQDRTLADPARPWKGNLQTGDGGVPVTLETVGCFVPPNTVREFGITSLGEGTELRDLLTLSQQIIIIPGNVIQTDFRQFTSVIDRGERWGIMAFQVLRPGPVMLLGFVGVRR